MAGDDTKRVDIAKLDQRMDTVEDAVKQINETHTTFCTKMEKAILGDVNEPGLVGQVRENKNGIEANRAEITKICGWGKWLLGIIGAVISGLSLWMLGKGGK